MSALARRSPEVAAPEVAAPETAPGVAPSPAAPPDFQATQDSRTHHGLGDSVEGQPVTVGPVTFTPGECASLVDFIGSVVNLERFDDAHLLMIKALVSANIEDAAAWDHATGGLYSELAQANESHFAGAGGFGANFAASLALAFQAAKEANAEPEHSEANLAALNRGRQHLYTAEHFLQDAFAAGHQVDPAAIDAAVDPSALDIVAIDDVVAAATYAQASDVIRCFGVVGPNGPSRIDSFAEFDALGVVGGAMKGEAGILDGLRKAVHETLETGVEVSSVAHPEPWILVGDHSLDEEKDTTSQEVILAAIGEVRTAFSNLCTPDADPAAMAQALHDRLIPTPTGRGQQTVDDAVAAATSSDDAIAVALTKAMVKTIRDVMQTVVKESKGLVVQMDELPEEEQDHPKSTPEFPTDPAAPRVPEPPVKRRAPDVELDPVVDLPMGDQRGPGWWTDPDKYPDPAPSGSWARRD